MQEIQQVEINNIETLHKEFISGNPFPYVVIDNFLDSTLALSLSHNFPAMENMDVFYKGLNERKGEHSNFDSLIIFLNENWEKEWGGCLQFSNTNRTEVVASIIPKFNTAVIFICNSISYHGYDLIQCPPEVTRKSFYNYYFTEPGKHLIFHDTVFQTTGHDSWLRKVTIITKEFLKNAIKKSMYYFGLNKFLK